HPQPILADEPTGNLDSKAARAVIDTVLQARDSLSATIFMVTHDSFAASFCDKVIILQDGLVWKELLRDGRERRAFQDELLNAIREMGR
ncbi:MAG: ABC transporter ATP-binding protein, partial [Schaedlerella arabinosiphila]|nr:ABC transporter ATP-binding protein [Schaedlerella arabinosiphila]